MRRPGDPPVRGEREIPRRMVRGVVHEHDVGIARHGVAQLLEGVVAPYVGVDGDEPPAAEQRQGPADPPAGIERPLRLP